MLLPLFFCSCDASPYVSPPPGATAIPTDAEIVVRFQPQSPARDVELRDATGVVVAVDVEDLSTVADRHSWRAIRPRALLDGDTGYVAVLLDPEESLTEFTTGADPDGSFPDAPAVTSISAGHVPITDGCSHSCYGEGYREFIELELEPGGGAPVAYYSAAFVRDGGAVIRYALPRGFDGAFDSSACGIPPPQLTAGEEYCVQVASVSVTGTRSVASAEVCTAVVQCPEYDPCAGSLDVPCLISGAPDAGATVDASGIGAEDGGDGGCRAGPRSRSRGGGTWGMLGLALIALSLTRRRASR